ncbi:uncharacterized protein METZ01_LOCUS126531 [marine metagenome]|uniref:Cupin type-2 domain-containing protein n=1 Tax=marine metagenome TaxID=408172 RepID=A0A381YB75_9ZZZZ
MYWKQTEEMDDVISKQIHCGTGKIKRRNLFGELSKLPIKSEIWELEEGVSEGEHSHEGVHPLEEIYYFLEGQGLMIIDGEDIPVCQGDAIMVSPESRRGLVNTGRSLLKLVIIWGQPAKSHV